jgi:ribosomal protein S18 acetylase RimI-like enzyme
VRRASELGRDALAEIFTAGYEDYFVPVSVDADGFARMVETSDIDLSRSFVATRDEGPVGIGLLAVRGDRAWIGGLGVNAAERRSGIGIALMEALLAEAAGLAVSLEVIEANEPAIRLYERLGFELVRMLEVWALEAPAGETRATPAELDAAHAVVIRHRRGPEPWQRADETVGHMRRRGETPEAVSVGEDGAALYRVVGPRASIAQLGATDDAVAAELLSAVRGKAESLLYVNVPEGDPASAALASLGGHLELRQLEMALPPA